MDSKGQLSALRIFGTQPNGDLPVELMGSMRHHRAGMLLPFGNEIHISRHVVPVDKPNGNVRRAKVPVTHQVVTIPAVAKKESWVIPTKRLDAIVTLQTVPAHVGNGGTLQCFDWYRNR